MILKYFIFATISATVCKAQRDSIWTYNCVEQRCIKTRWSEVNEGSPLALCRITCDEFASLFPYPSKPSQLGKTLTSFYPWKVTINHPTNSPLFAGAADIFKGYLDAMNPGGWNDTDPTIENHTLIINIAVTYPNTTILTLDTDESYSLRLIPDDTRVIGNITAANFYGARHALETLSQLIAYDGIAHALQVLNNATIADAPVYKYRGIAVDTSRNFISIPALMRIIDGLSYNKMNMFHWHITDTHSFPMEVDRYPHFTRFGAYSSKKVYTRQEMLDFVEYARVRGVKVVPEFDQPAHTGFGWEFGPENGLGDLVVCLNKQPWYDYCVEPPCGQLNVVNENVYTLLGAIYTSMLSIFDKDLFHLGGDEVDFRCYNSSQEITDWMSRFNYTRDKEGFLRLWERFQDRTHSELVAASGNAAIQSIQWSSELTGKETVGSALPPTDYIIQIWTGTDDAMIPDLLNAGYRTIFSNYDALYLDCGYHSWIGNGHNWCSPYKTWQTIYENDPHRIYSNATNSTAADEAFEKGLLLGAEAPLWMEQADELSFETRIWPRASALAERLWSNPTGNRSTWKEAEVRMVTNRDRMVRRGIVADRIQPEYCADYQGQCYGYPTETEKEPEKDSGGAAAAEYFKITLFSALIFHNFL